MTSEQTKEYLKRICILESNLYGMQKVSDRLGGKIIELRNYKGRPCEKLSNYKSEDFDLATFGGCIGFGAMVGFFIRLILLFFNSRAAGNFRALPKFILAGAIAFGVIYVVIWLICDNANDRDVDEHNKIVAENNKKIQKSNEIEIEQSKLKAQLLETEKNSLDRQYTETKRLLERYYNVGIIFKKYWNFVAVTSFYEYFVSGRCEKLEGHEGAYNIFENEIRQDIIIRKLDDVIEHLESIEENQYLLYSAIKQQNQTAKQLTHDIRNCAISLRNIETDAEVVKYHSEIAAQNTEYLTWLTVLDNH